MLGELNELVEQGVGDDMTPGGTIRFPKIKLLGDDRVPRRDSSGKYGGVDGTSSSGDEGGDGLSSGEEGGQGHSYTYKGQQQPMRVRELELDEVA